MLFRKIIEYPLKTYVLERMFFLVYQKIPNENKSMKLSEKDITKYRKVYRELSGKNISEEEASKQLNKLILFIQETLKD